METIVRCGVQFLFAVLGVLASIYLIPWLKEKRLYDTVTRLVAAAEKLGESLPEGKKNYVLNLLADMGVEITPVVDALIEAAVQQLDLAYERLETDGGRAA